VNKLVAIIIPIFLTFTCSAELHFCSSDIWHLYQRLPDSIRQQIPDSVFSREGITVIKLTIDDSLHIKIGGKNKIVESVGLDISGDIFSNHLLVDKQEEEVWKFAERAFLRFWFRKDIVGIEDEGEAINCKLHYNNKKLSYSTLRNKKKLFSMVNTAETYTLNKDNYFFHMQWGNGGDILTMAFPNDYQLIRGMNKKELDHELCRQLCKIIPEDTLIIDQKQDTLLRKYTGSATYMKLFTSELFYSEDSLIIFDRNRIKPSMQNLFLNKELWAGHGLHIRQMMYGGESIAYSIRLSDFMEYFNKDFIAYIGMESCNPDSIEGTVILSNNYFNFIHLLHFRTVADEAYNDKGTIEACLYGNIPMHNVSELDKKY